MTIALKTLSAPGDFTPMSLNGDWAFLPGHPTDSPAGLPGPVEGAWGVCPVPGLWWEARGVEEPWLRGSPPGFHAEPCGWYRRVVRVPAERDGWRARLEVDSAFWGFEAWVNGVFVGRHESGYSPAAFDVTAALWPGEDNDIVFKLRGWPAIPRDAEGAPLITVGVQAPWANKAGGFTGDVRLRFHRQARIDWIQCIPDVGKSAVRARVRVASEFAGDAALTLAVGPVSIVRPVRLEATTQTLEIDAPVPNASLWSPDNPVLYEARVTLSRRPDDAALDERTVRFGMRRFERRGGELLLNGEPIRLYGASLFEEPRFKRGREATTDLSWVRRYLVEWPRRMNANVLRTHLGPAYDPWLDACDEGGMMIVLEFPVFYWRDDPRFRDFVMGEYEALLPRLWNHPSIVIYSISNEPWNDPQRDFEAKTVEPWFRAADPTRLLLRAGDPSGDFGDIHCYEGFWNGAAEDYVKRCADHARYYRERNLPIANSEYIETGSDPLEGVWHDRDRIKRFFDDRWTSEGLRAMHAEIAAEQTEWLRALDFAFIMPYWFADWVNDGTWISHRDDPMYPRVKPTYWALRQAFSPVAPSLLECANRNVSPGGRVGGEARLFNDLDRPASGRLRLLVTRRDPGWRPETIVPSDILVETSADVIVPARNQAARALRVTLPADAPTGDAWLVALFEPDGGATTTLSQRRLRVAVDPRKTLEGVNVALVHLDAALQRFLDEQGARIAQAESAPADAVFLVPLTGDQPPRIPDSVVKQIREGARCVVLRATAGAGFPDDIAPKVTRLGIGVDYLFAAAETGLPSVPDPNGLTAAFRYQIEANEGDRVLLYGYPDGTGRRFPVVFARPCERGRLVFCQIELDDRLAPGAPHADPFCRALLVELLRGNGF